MSEQLSTPTLEQMKENLQSQLQQALSRYHDLSAALENTKTALTEEDRKVKMIKDTLQGLNLGEQLTAAQNKSLAPAEA